MLTAEESTFENEELSQEARWSYYVSAYTMRDPTEGVPFSQMRMPFLKRSLPPKLEQDEEYNRYYRRLVHQDGLIIRICANSYHILYEPGSYDWWWRPTMSTQEDAEENAKELAAVKERRHDRFREKFVNNPGWAHGLSKDEVDESNQKFRAWVKDPNSADVADNTAVASTAAGEGSAPAAAQEEQKQAPSDEAAATKEKEDADMVDAEPETTKVEEE